MRRIRILFLSILLISAGGFAYAFWVSYLSDDFDVYLQAMGYNSLHPPRNDFRLGSLYDIDENGNLDSVCPTTEAMADSYTGPDLSGHRSSKNRILFRDRRRSRTAERNLWRRIQQKSKAEVAEYPLAADSCQ
jgi:hypothetical protein